LIPLCLKKQGHMHIRITFALTKLSRVKIFAFINLVDY